MSVQSEVLSLGTERKVIRSSGLTQVLLGVGLGVIMMGVALALGIDWSDGGSWTALLCSVGILTVGASAVGLPGALRSRRTRVTVYDHGFVYDDGKAQASMRWEDIVGVWLHYVFRSRGRLVLSAVHVRGRDGRQIVFNPNKLSAGLLLTRYIEQKTLETLLPAYWSSYSSGQTLTFGPFQVSQAGLAAQEKLLSWDQVKSARITIGYLSINESGLKAWASAPLGQIPNAAVLLALIDRITGGAAKVSLPQPVQI